MKMRALLAVVPLIVLTACGSGGDAETSTTTGTADAGASSGAESSSAPATLGPELPPATAVAEPIDDALLPTATGAFGEKPTISFPDVEPPQTLQRQILTEGDGAVAEQGNTVVVNYYGVVWDGTEPFDNSYDREAPFTFAIGGQVISGWSLGLEGVPAGSRVLLTIPPANGYGAAGSGESIPGGATLAFVVDVIEVFGSDATGDPDAAPQEQDPKLPQVSGAMTGAPTVEVPADAVEPTELVVAIINEGSGEPIADGDVLAQMVFYDWTGALQQSTWPSEENEASGAPVGPQTITVTTTAEATPTENPLGQLVGVPLGSRVMLILPATPADQATGNPGQPTTVAVLDLVAQV